MSNEELKSVVLKANEFLSSLEIIAENLTEENKKELSNLSTQSVGLRNINKFNVKIELISHADLKQARQELTSAIVAEKWLQGFAVAIKVMSVLGGI